MMYLVLKELAGEADDVIMVTSSIMKDTAVGSDVIYRANAIRALCRIIDVRAELHNDRQQLIWISGLYRPSDRKTDQDRDC